MTSSDLDVGPRLVGDLHDELAAALGRRAHQVVQDEEVHGGAQVVDVGDEDVLLPLGEEFVQQAAVLEAGVDVAVTRRVPALRVLAARPHVLGDRQQRLFVDPRVPETRTRGGRENQENHKKPVYTDSNLLHTPIFPSKT